MIKMACLKDKPPITSEGPSYRARRHVMLINDNSVKGIGKRW